MKDRKAARRQHEWKGPVITYVHVCFAMACLPECTAIDDLAVGKSGSTVLGD